MKTASTAIAAELCEIYGGEMILHKHASMGEFQSQASNSEKRYFSFAGVRNPLDVAVSRFVLRKAGRNSDDDHRAQKAFIESTGGDFNKYFVEYVVSRHRKNIGIVPSDWNSPSFQSIDYIYNYENLEFAFPEILRKIGIEPVRDLPAFNQTFSKKPFLDYYDERTLQLACQVFRDYMAMWNYEVNGRF